MGGHEPTYFLRARYIRAVEELGGIPLILPLVAGPSVRRRLLDCVDGLLITGSGPDLPPHLYGEQQRYKFRLVSERRADFELELVHQARKQDLPLLGICGGMQTVNVACGGSLYQDIPAQVPGALDHRQKAKAVQVAHPVTVTPESLLNKVVAQSKLMVNSSHHQSVKAVAPSLRASAVAPDGIIEAIESPCIDFYSGFNGTRNSCSIGMWSIVGCLKLSYGRPAGRVHELSGPFRQSQAICS